MKRFFAVSLAIVSFVVCSAQSANDYNEFRQKMLNEYGKTKSEMRKDYDSFRSRVNADYANFLRKAWDEGKVIAPIPKPKEDTPVPPVVFEDSKDTTIVEMDIVPIVKPQPMPSPQPIEPIKENENKTEVFPFDFYGLDISIRVPQAFGFNLTVAPEDIASAWEELSNGCFDNSLVDLLSIRKNSQLCDWAYMQLLKEFSDKFSDDKNTSTLLTAWLLCQSGYQIRLGHNNREIILLYASDHTIYEKSYFNIDGMKYYPLGGNCSNLNICNAKFEGETPLSLIISQEQMFGNKSSNLRTIKSDQYPDINVSIAVNENYIDFYNSYPSSSIGDNSLSRWAIYADTPLTSDCANSLYSEFRAILSNCSKLEAAERLLNWVQTGLEYEYDDNVWGKDRAFFVEETLYYSYADCEDRSILFSRLVRDLLGLDVALIYYPGHLATAVKFDTEVKGDAMIIDGEKYIVCDPTYIGAPVGSQIPRAESDKAQAIVLQR